MIDLIPAIDLIDGKCVRLSKGDFSAKSVYSSDPVDMAMKFGDYGFARLHLVDLEGAGKGRVKHLRILEKIAVKTNMIIDFGGGVQGVGDVSSIFNAGAALVCVGSMAVKKEDEFDNVLDTFGSDKILLAADTRNEMIVISGWKEDTGIPVFDYIEMMLNKGISRILCTDADKDGMLGGVSLNLYEQIIERFPKLYLVASGGVSGILDIEILNRSGIPAVVFGKAFYEGRLKIEDMKGFF